MSNSTHSPHSERSAKALENAQAEAQKLKARLYAVNQRHDVDEQKRLIEALLFASREPLSLEVLREFLSNSCDLGALIVSLQRDYAGRGINLVFVAGGYRFQTAPDLESSLVHLKDSARKLSQAALETLAIIAYHQPVTRPEIEDIRGVAVSTGTLDLLFEQGWICIKGRRRTPGRPSTYGTTHAFLAHFNLESIADLPGKEDLLAAGLLDAHLPNDFIVPDPQLSLEAADDDMPEDAGAQTDFVVDFLGAPYLDKE